MIHQGKVKPNLKNLITWQFPNVHTMKKATPTSQLRPCLAQFLQEHKQQYPNISPDLFPVIQAIAAASKTISHIAKKVQLTDLTGSYEAYNATGDEQQKLDIIAHQCFSQALADVPAVSGLISEEKESIISFKGARGSYLVAIDPLDGSANIDISAPIGTIFSIYRRQSPPSTPLQEADFLQAGQHQFAAGYILYSTTTTFVYTAGEGVHSFVEDPNRQDFVLVDPAIKMPQDGHIYAVNDGYFEEIPRYVQRYIQQCRQQGYTARYIGALVADFHRHLLQGGIYLYPPTPKNPKGKLRLMLECNALALIAQQAGGMASNGQQSILTLPPRDIHQRVPLYIGSAAMVHDLLAFV